MGKRRQSILWRMLMSARPVFHDLFPSDLLMEVEKVPSRRVPRAGVPRAGVTRAGVGGGARVVWGDGGRGVVGITLNENKQINASKFKDSEFKHFKLSIYFPNSGNTHFHNYQVLRFSYFQNMF